MKHLKKTQQFMMRSELPKRAKIRKLNFGNKMYVVIRQLLLQGLLGPSLNIAIK